MVFRQQKGFMMIEVTIAILILALAVTAVGYTIIRSVQANEAAKHMTDAVNLAQEKLEDIKRDIEEQKTSTWNDTANFPYTLPKESLTVTQDSTAYTRQGTVTLQGDASQGEKDPDNKLALVTVEVSWLEKGKLQKVTFTTNCLRHAGFSSFPEGD